MAGQRRRTTPTVSPSTPMPTPMFASLKTYWPMKAPSNSSRAGNAAPMASATGTATRHRRPHSQMPATAAVTASTRRASTDPRTPNPRPSGASPTRSTTTPSGRLSWGPGTKVSLTSSVTATPFRVDGGISTVIVWRWSAARNSVRGPPSTASRTIGRGSSGNRFARTSIDRRCARERSRFGKVRSADAPVQLKERSVAASNSAA